MPKEKPEDINQTVSSENIFDEFTNSDEIKKEIEQTDKNIEKDIYFYLKKISSVLLVLNIIALLLILFSAFYIYVQEGEDKKEFSFLSPVCSVFLWSNEYFPNTCYGISAVYLEYGDELSSETNNQIVRLLPLIWEVYSLENFNLSKKVSFILEKSENRLTPLRMLENFDEIKNIFSPTDKWEIACYDIAISNNILDITCDSFSSDWNTDILTVQDTTLASLPGWWTSISKASSFLYFIENYSKSLFEIIEKPSSFNSQSVQVPPYTQKTTFQFQLQFVGEGIYQIN